MAGELLVSRQEFHKFMSKVPWPMAPVLVANFARRGGAPEPVLEVIGQVENRIYMSESDFWEEFCKGCRERGQAFHD